MKEYLKRAKELKESVTGNYEHSTNIQDEELVDWLIKQAEKVERYENIIAQCRCEECGHELGDSLFNGGTEILCRDCNEGL